MDVAEEDISAGPLTAIVFKTLADPFVGKLSYLRVIKGTLKADSTIYDLNKEKEERYGALLVSRGKAQTVSRKLRPRYCSHCQTDERSHRRYLREKGKTEIQPGVEFPEPTFSVAVSAKTRNDEDKMASSLNRMIEDDPTLHFVKNPETKESVLTGMGETHLDIIIDRLKNKFGVEVTTKTPRVPYRENYPRHRRL